MVRLMLSGPEAQLNESDSAAWEQGALGHIHLCDQAEGQRHISPELLLLRLQKITC